MCSPVNLGMNRARAASSEVRQSVKLRSCPMKWLITSRVSLSYTSMAHLEYTLSQTKRGGLCTTPTVGGWLTQSRKDLVPVTKRNLMKTCGIWLKPLSLFGLLPFCYKPDDVRNLPNLIGHARSHSRSHAQRLVNANEIIDCGMSA